MTTAYLSYKELGEIHGLAAASAKRYFFDGRLPDSDVVIGGGVLRGQVPGLPLREEEAAVGRSKRSDARYGYSPETALGWERVGQGTRSDLRGESRPRKAPVAYLSYKELGEIHNLSARSAETYLHTFHLLPEPDIVIGGGLLRGKVAGLEIREESADPGSGRRARSDAYYGWLPETALGWERLGAGARTDLRRRADERG